MGGFQNAKIIRIIPDQPGRGGSKSSLSTHSINLDIRTAFNTFVTYGRWRRAQEAIPASGYQTTPDVAYSLALHNYATFDTTNANKPPVDKLLSHDVLNSGQHSIIQHNTLATVKSYVPSGDDAAVPASFLNIKNRCFMCWAATNNFIYDSSQGITYDVGVDAPTTAATYTFGDTDSGVAAAAAGNTHVNWITSTTTGFSNDTKAIVLDGVTYETLQPNPLVTTFTSGTCHGTGATTTLTIEGQNWPLGDYIGLLIDINTGAETHFINSYVWAGPDTTVTLDTPLGGGGFGAATPYTLDGIGNTQLVLASPYTGATSLTISFTTFQGPLSWSDIESPPQYAYAYYDSPYFIEGGTAEGTATTNTLTIHGAVWGPNRYIDTTITVDPTGTNDSYTVSSYSQSGSDTVVTTVEPLANNYAFPPGAAYVLSGTLRTYGTGHISNISPVTFVTEKNQRGVSVVLHDIMDSGVSDQARFNKIQIFRTIIVGGGATLFPFDPTIGMVNNDGNGPHDFTDIYDDSFLLSAGGLAAPIVSNRKPPPAAHEAYWDGRVWINPVNDPSAIAFSGDISDILYGVPEECYPSNYILRIPSDDGRVTGMKLVGPIVVVSTERYAYYIVGGPTFESYRLRRFSTMMYGVGDYQETEFVGQTTDDSDSLLYLGKDKKVYLTAPSLGNIPMSDPVQDVFNADITTGYASTRIADIAINGNHYIVCTLENKTEVYDWERKIWTDHIVQVKDVGAVRPEAYAKVYGSTVPVQFLFVNAGAIYDWLGENGTTGAIQSYVATNPIMMGEKARWMLNEVRLYVSDNSNPWGVATSVNEGGGFQWEAIPQPDPLNALQGAFPLDAPDATELIMVPFVQNQAIQAGYRFQAIVNWPGDTVIRDLYAIDLILTKIEEDGQASV